MTAPALDRPIITPTPLAEGQDLRYALHHHPQSSHRQIAERVRRLGRAPVLDVGAAQGFLGQVLQGAGLEIDAVEPHPIRAALAEPFYTSVYVAPVEQAPLPAGRYPVVVCADVLEHIVDPAAVLRRLRRAAAADATFIVSLPNIAHLSARLLLLTGHFPEMERGIFDRTHLHFYTRRTAETLLEAAGLQVVTRLATPVPLDLVWPHLQGSRVLDALMRLQQTSVDLLPDLFGYQWILVARPTGAAPGP